MGNMCSITDQEVVTNTTPTLKLRVNNIPLEVINGNYKKIKSQCLVLICQKSLLPYSSVLEQAAENQTKVLQQIMTSRNIVEIAQPLRSIQFNKIVICCMPIYESTNYTSYIQHLNTVLKQIFLQGKDLTFVFRPTSGQNTLPNQIIISAILSYMQQNSFKSQTKIKFISEQKSLSNMCKLEIMKASLRKSERYQFERAKIMDIEPNIQY